MSSPEALKSLLVAPFLISLLAGAGSLDAAEYRVYVAYGEGYPPHLGELLSAPGNHKGEAGATG